MSLKGSIKGLKDIKDKVAAKSGGNFDGESPFLTLKDGESYKIRFLQELDSSSPEYDDRRGEIVVVEEHTSPKDFKKRAVCTFESDGKCWACEQTSLPEIGKKWKPRMRFYTNVIVRGTDGAEDRVKILAQGFSDKNVGNDIINIHEEFESLGAMDCKISRKGSGMNDTSYSLLPLAPKPMTKADQALEVIDLTKFIKYVEYNDQAAYYNGELEESQAGSASDWLK